MKKFRHCLLKILGAKTSIALLVVFCILSFSFGQAFNDMNLFASSGAIISVFGLLYTIKFTTLKKITSRSAEVASRGGVTGGPISAEEGERIRKENLAKAEIAVREEIKAEILGVALTILGTFIWAYGSYIKIIPSFAGYVNSLMHLQ